MEKPHLLASSFILVVVGAITAVLEPPTPSPPPAPTQPSASREIQHSQGDIAEREHRSCADSEIPFS